MKAEFRPPYSKNREPLWKLLPLLTPLTIYVDPSNVCNFSCQHCFHGNKNWLEKMPRQTMMDMNLFGKILNDLKEFPSPVKMIHLNGFGEPLLNKNLSTMIRLLKTRGIAERVAITTNGSKFTDENMKEIIKAGLDQIHISIYGLSQAQYAKFTHNNFNFNELVANIKKLYSIKGNCHIHIKISGNYFSEEEQKRFLEIFRDFCDTIFIGNAVNAWPGIDIKDTLKVGASLRHQYCQDIVKGKICPNLFYQLLIHSDGACSPCCVDFEQKNVIGDVNKESLINIWRNKLQNKQNKYTTCRNCEFPIVSSTVNINPYAKELLQKYKNVEDHIG
jgi:MoaA/NifB/PqqE/SkfB family radical SAM enzyme